MICVMKLVILVALHLRMAEAKSPPSTSPVILRLFARIHCLNCSVVAASLAVTNASKFARDFNYFTGDYSEYKG